MGATRGVPSVQSIVTCIVWYIVSLADPELQKRG